MADLSVTYLGLKLRNPLIAASSGLTGTIEGVRKALDAGAGAVALKSLFEEQLRAELKPVDAELDLHPEAASFLDGMGMNEGTDEYLRLVEAAKKDGRAPVMASVNCAGGLRWAEFARRIEVAGADALELNMGWLPVDPAEEGSAIEKRLVGVVEAVAAAVKLPLAVKLGTSFTNVGNMVKRVARAGARGVVLFNRYYRMDVDLDAMSISAGPVRGSPEAFHESLRWISLLEGRAGAEMCASGGVYDGVTALKLVAAGANAVELCSALYAKGYGVIGQVLSEMSGWMDSRNVKTLAELHGRLARRNSDRPEVYGRLHYVKALTGQG